MNNNKPNNSATRTLKRTKETTNKVVFSEVTPPGEPPIVETLYLPKWKYGEAKEIQVTVNIL